MLEINSGTRPFDGISPAQIVNQSLTRPQQSFLLVDTRDKGARGVQEETAGDESESVLQPSTGH